jgi:hypothetical protein
MMEKNMSKTNDTSRPATLEDHHTLADSELEAVSGGIVVTKPTDVASWRAPRPVSDGTSNTLSFGE